MKTYYVYILASKKNGTLCIGVTSNLYQRIEQHSEKITEGFTSKYDVKKLVYIEQTSNVEGAIYREKQLKHCNRAWKIELIKKENPEWKDLTNELL